ncbi:cytochrome P450 3A14-like isoform X2 [Ostrea edulis]|uniref:cytochrome P450 3A14-like isoform X2 n=1 Tax=Ostrea edulis TaxID=37623 RepID=UPI0024AE9C73|nr:cytochrome P450 3A14-like isoform X2 [Ostrea edulis]
MDILGLVYVPSWLLTFFLFLISLYLYSKYKLSFWKRLGVPHPKPTLFFGHGPLMKDGVGELDLRMLSTYDKVVGLYVFHKASLLVLDPEIQYFKQKSDLQHSLSRLHGDHWRFMRNTLSPVFATGNMRKISPVLAESCRRLLRNIEDKKNCGNAIEFKQMFGNFSMDAIAALGFGIDLDLYKNENNEFAIRAQAIFNAFKGLGVFLNLLVPPLYNLLVKLGLDLDGQSKHCLYFKRLVEQAKTLRQKDDQNRNDILQLMLNVHNDTEVSDTEQFNSYKDNREEWRKRGLTTNEVNGNSIMFMVAGYETTASALTFTAYCLATNPESQDRLLQEIDSTIGKGVPDYDSIQKMEYLECVVKEALRICPPAQRIMRETCEDLVIAGYTIPKNTEITISTYALHRSPKFWTEPEKYKPERFLAVNKSNLTPYTFLPFGLGPRSCLAMRLAYFEAKCALVTILQKYKFMPCEKTEIPLQLDPKLVLKPKNGVYLTIKER